MPHAGVLDRALPCTAAGQEVVDLSETPGVADFLLPPAWREALACSLPRRASLRRLSLWSVTPVLWPPDHALINQRLRRCSRARRRGGAHTLSHLCSPVPLPSPLLAWRGGGQAEADGAYGDDTLDLPEHASALQLFSWRGALPVILPTLS